MNRRSVLTLLGLAPVAAPAVASFEGSPRVLAHNDVVTPHAQIGPRTVGLEGGTGSYRAHATRGEGPVVTPPMHVQAGADRRVMLALEATPLGRGSLRVRRNGDLVSELPGNWSLAYPGEYVGQWTWAAFVDAPGPGEHVYTLECDVGGEVALIATVS